MNLFPVREGIEAFKAYEKHCDEFDTRSFEILSIQNEEKLKFVYDFLRLGKTMMKKF